jgi:hypothetical protein
VVPGASLQNLLPGALLWYMILYLTMGITHLVVMHIAHYNLQIGI